MFGCTDVQVGMQVRSADGEMLGAVRTCREDQFIVEKHAFSTADYLVSYDDVAVVAGSELRLSRARSELERFAPKEEPGPMPEVFGDEGGGGHG